MPLISPFFPLNAMNTTFFNALNAALFRFKAVNASNNPVKRLYCCYFSSYMPLTSLFFPLTPLFFRLNAVNSTFLWLNAVNAATFLGERLQRCFFSGKRR